MEKNHQSRDFLIATTFYLQEDKLDSASVVAPAEEVSISNLCPTCTSSIGQYGFSAWVYKVEWASSFNFVFRVANTLE